MAARTLCTSDNTLSLPHLRGLLQPWSFCRACSRGAHLGGVHLALTLPQSRAAGPHRPVPGLLSSQLQVSEARTDPVPPGSNSAL